MRNLIKKILKEEDFSGWVNVKIDNQIQKRIKRMMNGLGFGDGKLEQKIYFLEDPINNNEGRGIKASISGLIILQSLKEIKDNFNATSGGFLFESFIAGLLGGDVIKGNKSSDIVDVDGKYYQLKLYDKGSGYIKETRVVDGKTPDYYVVGVKDGTNIDLYIMLYVDFLEYAIGDDEFVKIERTPKTMVDIDGNEIETYGSFGDKARMTIKEFVSNSHHMGTMKLGEIESMSKAVNAEIMPDIKALWEEISQLHFNIESIVTGVSPSEEQIDSETAAFQALENTSRIDTIINRIYSDF